MLILVLTGVIYSPLFVADEIINRDQGIVKEIQKIDSIHAYINAIKDGQILDVQPVRDISIYMDKYLEILLGKRTDIYHNIFLWLLILFLMGLNLREISSKKATLTILLFIAVHPLFPQTFAWGFGRKHILSLLFILLTLYFYQKKQFKFAWPSYLLSVLSQPISLLFPIWCLIDYKLNKKKQFGPMALVPFFAIMLIVGAINYYYFKFLYPVFTGHEKIDAQYGVYDSLLAFGRYFIQLLFPVLFASSYHPGTLLNLIGIPLGVIIIFLSYKLIGKKETIKFFSLYFISLAVVTLNMTDVFINDSYLLFGSFSLIMLLASIKFDYFVKYKKTLTLLGAILVILLTLKSRYEVSLFTNKEKYLEVSYQREPNCLNAYTYLKYLFQFKKIDKASRFSPTYLQKKCVVSEMHERDSARILFSKILVYSDDKYVEARERNLKQLSQHALYYKFAYGIFLLRNKRTEESMDILKSVLSHQEFFKKKERDIFIDEYIRYCASHNNKVCQEFIQIFDNKQP